MGPDVHYIEPCFGFWWCNCKGTPSDRGCIENCIQ